MSFIDNFEQTLKDFFFRYHPRQMKKIPQIISEFKGKEKEVMLHLCKTYKVDPNSIEGLNSYSAPAPVVEEPVAIEESTAEAEEVVEENNEEEVKEEVSSEASEAADTEEEKTEEKAEKKSKKKKD